MITPGDFRIGGEPGESEIAEDAFWSAIFVPFFVSFFRLLSRDRKSSEQFACFNRRYDEMKAELALSGIVSAMMSETNQKEAI
jgi:hypothetical protein